MALTVATAVAQKPIQHIEVEKCETIEFSVVDWPGDRYTWDLYRDSTVNYAKEKGDVDPVPYFEKGMYQGHTVQVNWLDTGRYFLRVMVWNEVECTNNLILFLVDVIEVIPEAELYGDSTCVGDPSFVRVVLSGRGPWDLNYSYQSDGNGNNIVSVNMNGITENEFTIAMPPLPVGATEIWVNEIITQCSINLIPSDKGRILIYPKPAQSKIYLKDE
ncbi:hypothetical protein MASR2M47_15780 [Draconibacterium sp.]